ncbi:MAG TPA: D-Ala-D-Ala carboxypeptidase family metallohydrolase [Gemmatimonadaceae bacterium]|nr:D-Ala-D-Ala carboxypeptidase family metallohydrolase [Gemmatimonadaceae bacterium]
MTDRGHDAKQTTGSGHGVLHEVERAVVDTAQRILHGAELAFHIPAPARSRWHRAGVSPRTERMFDIAGGTLLATFALGWSWSVATADARTDEDAAVTRVTASITSALTNADAPTAAFLTEAAMEALLPLRGESGRLHAQFREPGAPLGTDTLPEGAVVHYSSGGVTDSAVADTLVRGPDDPGIWSVAVKVGAAIRPLSDFNVITLKPFSAKQRGRIGLYYLGSWPNERGRGPARYSPPRGFIEVTQENRTTHVSEHFRLGDFLTKNQFEVWPKYLVLETRLLDKLELVLAELRARGIQTSGVKVLSGFRTPQYNRGGGDPRGRAALSRHMYGDAADIYIDNDGNGAMDDLNGDGRVNIRDARVIQDAVDRVERAHPQLIGGCGTYPGTGSHGPFTHIDTRGYRARWVGTGDSG